jgi:hypothetical protein
MGRETFRAVRLRFDEGSALCFLHWKGKNAVILSSFAYNLPLLYSSLYCKTPSFF